MRIPPPIIFVGSILLGVVLGLVAPIPSEWLSASLARLVGIPIVVISFILVGLTFREFREVGTGFDSEDTVTALITGGLFCFTRNPMYLSGALLQLGLGIWLKNTWIALLLLPTIPLINVLSILPEERLLEERFGERYGEYRRRVRQWL